jgi:CDP-glucose 4,6-dehydratase
MSDFWKNKKVFITGHSGFKGSWLCTWLLLEGAEVSGYSLRPNSFPSLFNLLSLEKKIKNYWDDIRDIENLKNALKIERPDIVFHLAAQPLVKKSYQDPRATFSTNIQGTWNLFEAIRHTSSVKTVINITTDKVYKPLVERRALDEKDELGANDPYSASKACSEIISRSFHNSFLKELRVNSATARSGNVIGGGDWSDDRLVPDIIRAMTSKSELRIRNPGAVRPWQHVLDSINGYLILAKFLFSKSPPDFLSFNFAPRLEEDHSVNDLLEEAIKLNPSDFPRITIAHVATFPEEDYIRLDSSLAQKTLGWNNRWNFETTVKQTFNWYNSYYLGEDPWNITISQINQFKKD